MLDYIFDDKRVAITVLMFWMALVCWLLQYLDLLHSDFVTFGPSSHSRFMTITIDTWPKWSLLASATFANTCVADFMSDAIVPWLQNTVQDHKTRHLPYTKCTCFLISQLWNLHSAFMSVFTVALIVSQIDLLLIRTLADLCVNSYTCFKFMRNKRVDHGKYWLWFQDEESTGVERRPFDATDGVDSNIEILNMA